MKEKETESRVKQEDVSKIMNAINKALRKTEYTAIAYDNTGFWLTVVIDKKEWFEE